MAKKLIIGMSTCNIAAGSQKVWDKVREEVKNGLDVPVEITGCLGMCFSEPQIQVIDDDDKRHIYVSVTANKMGKIIESHIKGNEPIEKMIFDPEKGEGLEMMGKQNRIVLANVGKINPDEIEDYQSVDGYKALEKVLKENDRDGVIKTVLDSGVRGRGGAGFPTGLKWKFAKSYGEGGQKYMVCNADEGDPGAFMDRTTLESDPHAVLEGMIIGAFAIGADEGYIYCRAEYPMAIKRCLRAIEQAKAKNLLGDNILGSDFSFNLHVKEGAGAFVCGEETALLTSIEGNRGTPRPRPPFPAESGLWEKPTNINNVETFANIPWIIRNGAEAYNSIGTEDSKGTKVFALAGKIKKGGLVEIPMGITLEEVIYEIGGGCDREIKGVQMGGPSGGCIPREYFNTKIDYAEINKTGAIMGSGGMIVLDDTTCMVDIARYFLSFTQKESCGKCTFCRIGTTRMLEILTRICDGEGVEGDIEELENLSEQIKNTSLCALGGTAPNPVLSTIRYFRKEYEDHIKEKKCVAGKCPNLCSYQIKDNCTGCTVCAKQCPVKCITGGRKQLHIIEQKDCVRCGVCRDVCKFDAVVVGEK